jgi:hypothetical protein
MAKIRDIEPYEGCSVIGMVLRLSLCPRDGRISAAIADGTGELLASWHLARPTPQLQLGPGTWVALTGVAGAGADGRPEMWEPTYSIVPDLAEVGA